MMDMFQLGVIQMTKKEVFDLYLSWGYEKKEEFPELLLRNLEEYYLEKRIGRWARSIRFLPNNTIEMQMYLVYGEYEGKKSNEWGIKCQYLNEEESPDDR